MDYSDPTKSKIVTGHKGSSREPEVVVPPLDVWFMCKQCSFTEKYNVWAGPPRCLLCTGSPLLTAYALVDPPKQDPLNTWMRKNDEYKNEIARLHSVSSGP